MGTVVLHAGMGKAGSTSVQSWLMRNAEPLRAAGIRLLTARVRPWAEAGVDLDEYRTGPLVANDIVLADDREPAARVMPRVFEALNTAADRQRVVILSAEAFERFFWRVDAGFLGGLEELARAHEVRVAYYVRPQHTAFEAQWRQWGFRSGRSPAEFFRSRTPALRYFETLTAVRREAPGISFEPRPLRLDMLDDADPGEDFGRHFLGVTLARGTEAPELANRGLPLEVVNALRYAPAGVLWDSIRDNRGLNRVKALVASLNLPESPETIASRRHLHAHCYETFEPGNRRLIAELGWNATSFITPPEDADAGRGGPAELDRLGEPKASRAELELLYASLAEAIARRPRPSEDRAARQPRGAQGSRAGRGLRRLRRRLGSRP